MRGYLSTAGLATVNAIDAISREMSDIRVRLDRLERIAKERSRLNALIDREARASEAVADLRPTSGPRRDNSRVLDARQTLATTFREWLAALRTPNIPADVHFDDELRLIISGERFTAKSSHSGSTRTRIVLAYHAAMVESSLRMNGVHPRLLVLDAPRQHELSAEDLRSYIERFHAMSVAEQSKGSSPIQLVFSATDPAIEPSGKVDSIWMPSFRFNEGPRFLGPASS
jgi:hypothetical protein